MTKKETLKAINQLAYQYTQHAIPHREEYQKQKLILLKEFTRLLEEGVSIAEALELLKDPKLKISNKYSEMREKLINSY